MLHPSNFIIRTVLGLEYRSCRSSLCSFLRSLVTLSLLNINILLSTLFSNALSLLSSVNASDQVSHPYKTTEQMRIRCKSYISLRKFVLVSTPTRRPQGMTSTKEYKHKAYQCVRGQLKCDGTRTETRFRLSAKRTSPFKSAGDVSSVDYWQPRCAHQR